MKEDINEIEGSLVDDFRLRRIRVFLEKKNGQNGDVSPASSFRELHQGSESTTSVPCKISRIPDEVS